MINIKANKERITRKDIKKLEKKIKMSLPQDYIEFLIQKNGGYLEDNVLGIKVIG